MEAISLYRKNAAEPIDSQAISTADQHLSAIAGGLTRRRIKAFIIDFIVICLATTTFILLVAFGSSTIIFLLFPVISIAWMVLFLAYFTLFLAKKKGATIGMRRVNIAVHLRNGKALGYKAAVWRALLFLIFSIFLTPITLLLVPITRGKRGLHDFLLGTQVVTTNPITE